MIKYFLFVIVPFYCIAAQDITFSKDSLKICNRFANDSIVLTNTASTSLHIDSAGIVFHELDTTGLFLPTMSDLNINISEHDRGDDIGWLFNPMEKISDNEYRVKFSPWTSPRNPPFYMNPLGDSTALKLTIANCLLCDFPKFPRYSTGLLRMYFSNGQTVELRFYSDDLRPSAVKQTPQVRRYAKTPENGAHFLINGRKIPAHPDRMNRRLHGCRSLLIWSYRCRSAISSPK